MNNQSVQSPQHFSNLPPSLHQAHVPQQQQLGSNMASPSPSSSTASSPSSTHQHHQQYFQLQQSYLDFAAAHHQQQQQTSPPSVYQNAQHQLLQQQQSSNQPSLSKTNSDLLVRQQYEQKIRALQMEIQAMKQAMLCFNPNNNNNNNDNNVNLQINNHTISKKSRSNHNEQQNPHIVETYLEEIGLKEFSCKNCSYKTKSEASLIIHNTNHLVSQRYLHLPTTVFSVRPNSNNNDEQQAANSFLYPCGECTGKYSHNDLYLHIYQHHTGEHPFHCDECNIFFMHYEFLEDHQRTEHNKNDNNSYQQQKSKKSRYYDQNNTLFCYYSVIKCNKPFASLLNPNINTTTNSSSSSSSSTSSSWINDTSNNQPAFPYVVPKRGRGRASHHSIGDRTSSSFQNLIQTTALARIRSSKNINNNNNRQSEFKCHYEDCFFITDTKERLDFHLFAHRNSRFKCPYCPYVSNVLNDIKRHCIKGQKHDGPMFTCPNCEHMQTNCDKTFKDHIRTVHFNKMVDEKMLQTYIEGLFHNNIPTEIPEHQ